jgi:hypothetical protein
VFFRFNKLLCTLLFAASAANASPIVTPRDNTSAVSVWPLDTSSSIVHNCGDFLDPVNSRLASLASEFLRSPIYSGDLSDDMFEHVKPLPAVPTAALMVLTGFLCVSLVKDRRIWLAALVGLLSVGQRGVDIVPKLVLHLGQRIYSNQQVAEEQSQSSLIESIARPRCDIESRYIGLLYYLAGIPNSRALSHLCYKAGLFDTSVRTEDRLRIPEFTATELLSYLILASNLKAPIAERHACFSPAFIFQNLSRGPPIFA